jgi:hypothetical protein
MYWLNLAPKVKWVMEEGRSPIWLLKVGAKVICVRDVSSGSGSILECMFVTCVMEVGKVTTLE